MNPKLLSALSLLKTLLLVAVEGYRPLSVALAAQAPGVAALALAGQTGGNDWPTAMEPASPVYTVRERIRFPGVKPLKVFWPEITTLSNRQLPELLFNGVPEALVQSAPVEAFTSSMANLGLLAARGSLMVAVSPVNQFWPPPVIIT